MEQLLAQLPLLLLVTSRVAGMTAASPVFTSRFMVPQVRVVFTFLLALVILPGASMVEGADTGTALLASCVLELLVGLIIGFMSQLVFAVVQMAGALLDVDMGFMMAQIVDPVTQRSEPIIGSFFSTLALVLYFALNAHHWLLRGLADSYSAIPAGGLVIAASAAPLHVVNLFGTMLSAAVQMVIPFIIVMLLATVAMAGIARAVPHLQIFQLGMGIKAVAGLAFLTVMLPYFLGFLERLFDGGHQQLLRLLEMMR